MNSSKAVEEINATIDAGIQQDLFSVDPRSQWLHQFGVLTEDLLSKMIVIIHALHSGIRSVEINYDRPKKELTILLYVKWWSFWFHQKKIKQMIANFIEDNLQQFDVILIFRREKN